MQPPIGISDFRELIETKDTQGHHFLFVDKSLFIKEILDDLTKVKLITRPRRFGKTLNMSMLQYFLASEINQQPTKNLFTHLKITQHEEYIKKHQGKYPVIFLSFKDIKETHYDGAYKRFCNIISQVYFNNKYLLSSKELDNYQKKIFETILEERATETSIQVSLLELTRLLTVHHGVKPWILIDEYDTPIQTAYFGGYYNQMIEMMRGFLGSSLKDNVYLENAVLTGILRVSKESLFSGLNNVITYSLLHPRYAQYFGFTESETADLLEKSGLNNMDSVRDWYNGYEIGGNTLVYNPWSIVNYIKEQGKLGAYWVNISDNLLLRELFLKSSENFKSQFQSLLQNETTEIFVNEFITFNDIETHDANLWSLLLMSGYLKARGIEATGFGSRCLLQIPNKEVRDLYRNLISMWLSGTNNPTIFNQLITNLLLGEMEDFTKLLQGILLQSLSIHDVKGKEPEKFYHGFMLGLLAGIDTHQYQIQSNKESGFGRFDITVIPKDPSKLGIIIEVKNSATTNHSSKESKNLKELAMIALQQIEQQNYAAIFEQNHVKNYIKIGVAFRGKELAVEHQQIGQKRKDLL